MSNIKKIEEEYANVEIEDYITSSMEVAAYFDFSKQEIAESRSDNLLNIKDENKRILKGRILNFFTFITQKTEDVEFYLADLSFLECEVELSFSFINYQTHLMNLLNETNYLELYSLAKMNHQYYSYYFAQFEYERDILYYQSRGIHYRNDKEGISSFNDYQQFMEKQIVQHSSSKGVEKIKKV